VTTTQVHCYPSRERLCFRVATVFNTGYSYAHCYSINQSINQSVRTDQYELLAWIIYWRGSSVWEPQFSANHLLTCLINLCQHLQFHSSRNTLLYRLLPPLVHSDFRQISITSVLCRTLERIIVRQFLYPAILAPPPSLSFTDQFAFRPTGSTTAALTAILQSITDQLSTNPFVIVIGLDFSKALDTLRHQVKSSQVAFNTECQAHTVTMQCSLKSYKNT